MRPSAVFLTGPAGVGKTAVGRALTLLLEAHGAVFLDADELHSSAARAKMAAGEPLSEADREPWLARLTGHIRALAASDATPIVACSALQAAHRRRLLGAAPEGLMIGLRASQEVLEQRVALRSEHFFPPGLVPSQLALHEPAEPGERLVWINAEQSLAAVVDEVSSCVLGYDPQRP